MNNILHPSKLLPFIIILTFIGIMFIGIFGEKESESLSPLIGKKIPKFSLETFDGKKINYPEYKGKILVLNFWSSWCVPCKDEVKVLNALRFSNINKEVEVIGINIWDDYENALSFLNKYSVQYVNAYDPDEEIQVNFGVEGVPETFIIDSNGTVASKFSGQLTNTILKELLNQIRKNESPNV